MHRWDIDAGTPAACTTVVDASDAWLIRQVVGGDRDAFERLYRAYFPRLTRFLSRLTRSVQLIEEIVDDTMLVVWQTAHRYNATCKVSTWVFAIAYRKACKAIKARDDACDTDPDLCEGDAARQPDKQLDLARLQHAIGAALDSLPLEQRTVVHLTYHHGMGYADIAQIMDCPLNTVKTRMFHARRRLKILLADQREGFR